MLTSRKILAELRDQGARIDRVLEELRADRAELRADRAASEARWERRDAELQELIRFNTEAFRRSELAFEDFRKEQREMREDMRAHTRALLALIDRLEGGGPAPAT